LGAAPPLLAQRNRGAALRRRRGVPLRPRRGSAELGAQSRGGVRGSPASPTPPSSSPPRPSPLFFVSPATDSSIGISRHELDSELGGAWRPRLRGETHGGRPRLRDDGGEGQGAAELLPPAAR
jgi:hypothetical protein